MSAHQPGAEPGRRVGKYRLLMPLDSGGMATVHLALSVGPRNVTQLVVIKVPRADFALDPEYHARFFDEARVAARLHHPHVVQTSDVFEHEGVPHIVMEHLEGQPLRRLTRWAFAHAPERSLPHRLRALTDALSGLHCAHELRDYDGKPLDVVHRDVSPDNVFVTYEGRVKVVDFGIAKAAGARHRTHAGSINGRIAYMAPEQLAGDQVDRRADVFSAGAMLWEEITGRSLWGGLPRTEIARRLLLHEVPRPREERAIARTPLVRICERALAPLPDDRYESADHMRRDLESVLRAWRQPVPYAELGALVSKAFERERAERRHRIDSLLARIDHTLRPPAPAPASAPPAALPGQGPRISFVPDDGDNEDLTRVVFTPPHAVPISSLHDDGEGMTRIVHTPPYAVPLASLHGENFDDNDDDDDADRTRVVHTPLDTVALTSLHDDDDEEPTRFTMNPLHADAFEHDEAGPRQASSVTINEFGDAENIPTRPHMPAPEIVLSRKPAATPEPSPGHSLTPGSTPSPNRLPTPSAGPSSNRAAAPSSSRSGVPSSSRSGAPSSSRSGAPNSSRSGAPSSSPGSRPPRVPAPDAEFVPTRSLPVPTIGPPSRPSALASSSPPRASAPTSSAPPRPFATASSAPPRPPLNAPEAAPRPFSDEGGGGPTLPLAPALEYAPPQPITPAPDVGATFSVDHFSATVLADQAGGYDPNSVPLPSDALPTLPFVPSELSPPGPFAPPAHAPQAAHFAPNAPFGPGASYVPNAPPAPGGHAPFAPGGGHGSNPPFAASGHAPFSLDAGQAPNAFPPGAGQAPNAFPRGAGQAPNAFPPGAGQAPNAFPPATGQAPNAPFAPNAGYAPDAGYAPNAPFASGAGYAPNAPFASGAGYAPNAPFAPGAGYGPNASFPPGVGFAPNAYQGPGAGFGGMSRPGAPGDFMPALSSKGPPGAYSSRSVTERVARPRQGLSRLAKVAIVGALLALSLLIGLLFRYFSASSTSPSDPSADAADAPAASAAAEGASTEATPPTATPPTAAPSNEAEPAPSGAPSAVVEPSALPLVPPAPSTRTLHQPARPAGSSRPSGASQRR